MEELRELLLKVTIKCNNIEEDGCGVYNFVSEYSKKKNRNRLIKDIRNDIDKLNEALDNLSKWGSS